MKDKLTGEASTESKKNVLEEEKEASVGQTKPERSGYIGRIIFDK